TSLNGSLFAIASSTGSSLFIAKSNGVVGIGTTSPFAKLSISANTGETNFTSLFAIASSTASATSTLFSVLTSGNVGIGTSNPWGKLSVSSAGLSLTWSQVGTGLAITNFSQGTLAALSPNRVAFFDDTNVSLSVYDFNGSTWAQVGTGLTISSASQPSLAALTPNRVAFIDETNDSLR